MYLSKMPVYSIFRKVLNYPTKNAQIFEIIIVFPYSYVSYDIANLLE